jgi:hypothetical protein
VTDSEIVICPMCGDNFGQMPRENALEFDGAFICEEDHGHLQSAINDHNESDKMFNRGNPVSIEGFFKFVNERTAWEELTIEEIDKVFNAYLILGDPK